MGRSRHVDAGILTEGGRDADPAEDGPRDPDGIAAYAPYRRAILGILAASCVTGADAEDLRQDILLEVVLAAKAGPVGSMMGLVVRVAGRRVARFFRWKARRRGEVYDDDRDGELLPESQRPFRAQDRAYEERRRDAVLRRLLERMEPELSAVFRLVDLEGMTVNDAAKVLELPPTTVKSRRVRAQKRFDQLVAILHAEARRER